MNLEDLGRRAVACKHWRWMPGMAVLCISYDQEGFYTSVDRETGKTVIEPFVKGELRTAGPFRMVTEKDLYDGEEVLPVIKRISVPDLSDPATLGCLLHLVRKAWPHEWHQFMAPIFDGISHWYVGCLMPGTSRIVMPTRVVQNGLLDALPPKSTEVEALVAALEAAP